MQTAVKRAAASVFTTALAASVLVGVAPATATTTSTCVATDLRLPEGMPTEYFGSMSASDPTGRYQVGHVQGLSVSDNTAVLWTDGEPRVLDPGSTGETRLIDVNSHGTVVGTTGPYGEDQPWRYSNGTFRNLEPPQGTDSVQVSAMNERGDVVGWAYDPALGRSVPVVWPGDGRPPVRLPADDSARAADINDAGVVVGSLSTQAGRFGLVWKRWDRRPTVVGKPGQEVGLREIRGDWAIGHLDGRDGSSLSGRWNLRTMKLKVFEDYLFSVNSSGDVSYTTLDGPAVVERPDGTSYLIDAPGSNTVIQLFDRGSKYDGAGDRDWYPVRAALWSGCSG